MKTRAYYAEIVEQYIQTMKNDYTNLMKKYRADDNEQGVYKTQGAIVALGALEDDLFNLDPIEVEV